jgi:hypothetical protein
MNTFAKIGNEWTVKMPDSGVGYVPGAVVPVTLRNGSVKSVTLAAEVLVRDGFRYYATQRDSDPAQPSVVVGDLSRIVALFDSAARHLRHPAIVLDGFRVNVAGGRAREPGSLTVTGVERNHVNRFGTMSRQYFGRVTRAGVYEPSRGAPEGLGARLRAFAADPAGQAAEYGRLHGVCCFCNHRLDDERSTAVGYGPVCARNFGLPWGTRAAAAAHAAPVAAQAPVAVAAARNEADARARSIASEEAMERGMS